MKFYCCLFIYLFSYVNPIQASFGLELTQEEEAAVIARYPELSFEEFKREYIDRNQPFRIVEFGGDRRKLYQKWVKKNGPDIPLYCWSLIEADIPKDDTRSCECELCGHTELGTLNHAMHLGLKASSKQYVKFVGSRCITYAVKTKEQLYEEFLAALPYERKDAVVAERTKRRKEQDDLLIQAGRNPDFRRRVSELQEVDSSSEDEEELAVTRRASLRSAKARGQHSRKDSGHASAALQQKKRRRDNALVHRKTSGSAASFSKETAAPLTEGRGHHKRKRIMFVDSDSQSEAEASLSPAVAAPTTDASGVVVEEPSVVCASSSISPNSTPIYARPADSARGVDLRAQRALFRADALTAWSKNVKGNYTRYVSRFSENATIFVRAGRWKYVLSDKFSRNTYSTALEAANAFKEEYDS